MNDGHLGYTQKKFIKKTLIITNFMWASKVAALTKPMLVTKVVFLLA
jgi:hypothetical protein